MAKNLFLCFVAILMIGCSEKSSENKYLEQLEEFLENNPDSAQNVINMLNIYEQHNEFMPKADRIFMNLLYADAQNKEYVGFKTDSVMLEVTNYYDRFGNTNKRIKAHYLLGCVYRDLGNTEKQMDCLLEAIDIFETSQDTSTFSTMYKIYGQKADIEYRNMLSDEMLRSLNKGIYYAYKAKDTIDALRIGCHKCYAYYIREEIDSAIASNNYFAKEFYRHGYTKEAAMTIGANMYGFLENGDYKGLKQAIDLYEQLSGNVVDGNTMPRNEIFYYFKGEYMLWKNYLDSAKYYFYKEQYYGKDIHNQFSSACGLEKLYSKLGIADSIIKYSKLSSELGIKMEESQDTDLLYELMNKHNSKCYNHNIEKKKSKFIIIEIITLILSIFVLICLYKYWEKRIIEKDLDIIGVKEENEHKIAKMNIQIEKLNEKYEKADIRLKMLESNEDEALSQIFASEAYQHILNALNEKRYLKIEEIKELAIATETVFPTFHQKINTKGTLSDVDFAICLLIRIHVRPKDIAILLGYSLPEISKKRKRLLKKLFGIDGKPKYFDDYIIGKR